jgi:hypothetical protein
MEEKAIEDAVELIHGREMDLEDEAILTGNAMTFDHLRDAARQFGNGGQLAGVWADPDVSGEGETERRRIEVDVVSPDDPGLLQAADALGHRGRRHPDPPSQGGHGLPGIAV